MEVSVVFLCSLLSLVASDTSSTYSILPYDSHHDGGYSAPSQSYGAPNYEGNNYGYTYDDDDYGYDYGYRIRNFFYRPVKAMKGARKHMNEWFTNAKSKFLELNGYLLQAKGSFLKASGENMLRLAYNIRTKAPDYYHPNEYHTGPTYFYEAAPTYHDYAENTIEYAPPPVQVHDYAAPPVTYDGTHGESLYAVPVAQSPNNFYAIQGGDQNAGHIDIYSIGHHQDDVLGQTAPDVGFGSPKDTDIIPVQGNSIDSQVYQQDDNTLGKRDTGFGRSARAYDFHQNSISNRDYHIKEDERPIPVPVAFPIQPSRLIFPLLQQPHQASSGYH